MGRPLWHALHKDGRMELPTLLQFAIQKLLKFKSLTEDVVPSALTKAQLLALLGPRFCITISPITAYASELVARHMARSEEISRDRQSVTISYPSEPILALASREYTNRYKKAGSVLLAALREFLLSGAVAKGHRGEVIVRFLNLWAMDKAMKGARCSGGVCEISFIKYLKVFRQTKKPLLPEKLFKCYEHDSLFKEIASSTVCFTHFIYLSNEPKALITQDLLRYAYRRTAALVTHERRQGIDWIIPLRLNTDTEEFIGLVGQDKNRIADSLEYLIKADNPETHENLHPRFFLSADELATFPARWRDVQWPSILFAVDVEGPGMSLVKMPDNKCKRLRSGKKKPSKKIGIPCIVMMGLDYAFLTNEERIHLKRLRDIVDVVNDRSITFTPLTYDRPNVTKRRHAN